MKLIVYEFIPEYHRFWIVRVRIAPHLAAEYCAGRRVKTGGK
jgi:hypothetical protein